MADKDTANAITTNIETIVTGLGYNVRSATEPRALVKEENFEHDRNFGESPLYAEQDYSVTITKQVKDKDLESSEYTTIKFAVAEAISIDGLNIGDLASSKLVADVTPPKANKNYDEQLLTVYITFTVRYRLN